MLQRPRHFACVAHPGLENLGTQTPSIPALTPQPPPSLPQNPGIQVPCSPGEPQRTWPGRAEAGGAPCWCWRCRALRKACSC